MVLPQLAIESFKLRYHHDDHDMIIVLKYIVAAVAAPLKHRGSPLYLALAHNETANLNLCIAVIAYGTS